MELVGSVTLDQMPAAPQHTTRGVWSALAQRAISDHEKARVTYVKLDDDRELRRLRNGMMAYMRNSGYRLSTVVVRDGPGKPLNVYLKLDPREEEVKPDAKTVRKVRRAGTR